VKKILLLFLVSIPIIAQEDYNFENNTVKGILFSNFNTYLILEDGYLKVNEIDPYEEYYRKVYNDSTLINPNTIITNNIDLTIIPFISNSANQKNFIFNEPFEIGAFIQLSNSDQYSLTPLATHYVDSLFSE